MSLALFAIAGVPIEVRGPRQHFANIVVCLYKRQHTTLACRSRSLKLSDLFRAPPGLQRRPQAAIEAEAIERRRRADGTDAIETDAGPLEAALFQHPARRRIADPGAGHQRVVTKLAEGVVDQSAHRFRGVAAAPKRHAEP